MAGETNLKTLFRSMRPTLIQGEYVFCSIDTQETNHLAFNPIATFREAEGLSLIIEREMADRASIPYESVFSMITLSVHSSLSAVGFLAAISSKLAEHGISVNPVSAYYHDHQFVPVSLAEEAMELLKKLSDGESDAEGTLRAR
ncbi:MAG: hypothetical protein N5P05_004372 (plasmid) [Chroococcopsis gigantea SAG 12.99]|jgi:hypothetical protein|nr:hypothetical protein [Chroococcopsis gigantea SAG 12.99]